MAKHSRRHRRRSRRMRGGTSMAASAPIPTPQSNSSNSMTVPLTKPTAGGGQYTDGASYGTYVNGPSDAQYNRVFGPEYANIPGNVIIGAQGQNIPSSSQVPTPQQLSLVQQAGRRRRRGGFLGEVVNQAVVPFALLGMQQTYRRKRGGKRHTRRHRRH
jgi:hypothetical protein